MISEAIANVLAFPAFAAGWARGAFSAGAGRGFMVASGYDGAERNRHRDNLQSNRTQARAEDGMLSAPDRVYLRQRCLDLRRNNALVAGIVERFADNVVGSGIQPQCKTTSEAWNSEAEGYWREWSKIVDVRGRLDMRSVQRQVVQQRLLAGDMAFILLASGQVQPIEGERIATPKKLESDKSIVDGIKLDAEGRLLAVYVFTRSDRGTIDTTSGTYEEVAASDIKYIQSPFRIDQVRSIPDLASILNTLTDLHELSQATIEKAKLDAFYAWAMKRNSGGTPGFGGRNSTPAVGTTSMKKVERGTIHYLNTDEEMQSLESKTPNSTYESFFKLIVREMGAALGLPYEFVLLDFSEGNFSSSRAALLQTYRTFTGWQEWLASQFLRPIWNWRIAKAVKRGVISPAPVDGRGISEWYRVDWQFPSFGWIDPNNEAIADQRELAMGKTTPSAIAKKAGNDYEDVMAQKFTDLGLAALKARDLNAIYPEAGFMWTDFVNLGISGGQTAQGQKKIEGSTVKIDGNVKEG